MYKPRIHQARITNINQSSFLITYFFIILFYTHMNHSLSVDNITNVKQITILYWLISYYYQRQVLFFSITIHRILYHYHKYSNRINIYIFQHYHLHPICYHYHYQHAHKMEIQRIIITNNNFTFLIKSDIKPIHSWLLNIFIQFFYNHLALHYQPS
jgi:hypothetical protein